jgi:hypothetical protein
MCFARSAGKRLYIHSASWRDGAAAHRVTAALMQTSPLFKRSPDSAQLNPSSGSNILWNQNVYYWSGACLVPVNPYSAPYFEKIKGGL